VRVIAAFAIVCGCLFIYGFLMADRIKISTRQDERKAFYVMVTAPNVTDARWIEVMICAAEQTEAGVYCLDEGGWDTSSKHEIHPDGRYEFSFGRYVPRGMLQVSVVISDANWKTLAYGQKRVFR
jgi:hypothetical protein